MTQERYGFNVATVRHEEINGQIVLKTILTETGCNDNKLLNEEREKAAELAGEKSAKSTLDVKCPTKEIAMLDEIKMI